MTGIGLMAAVLVCLASEQAPSREARSTTGVLDCATHCVLVAITLCLTLSEPNFVLRRALRAQHL